MIKTLFFIKSNTHSGVSAFADEIILAFSGVDVSCHCIMDAFNPLTAAIVSNIDIALKIIIIKSRPQ